MPPKTPAPDKYGFPEQPSGVWCPVGSLMFPLDRLITAEWNPNKQSEKVFKDLVKSIQEDGFLEAIQVAPVRPEMREKYLSTDDGGDYWLIVGGAHRKDAAVLLGMKCVPVIVKMNWDEDMVKFRNMRLNMLKGRVEPAKFASLFNDLKGKGYDDEFLKAQMGLVEEKAFKNLVKSVKENLPKSVQDALDDSEADIQNTDDLARVLNELFSKHGDTLPYGYMVFDFGGKTNFWVPMDRLSKAAMDATSQQSYKAKVNFNRVLTNLLADKAAVDKAMADALASAEAEDSELYGF